MRLIVIGVLVAALLYLTVWKLWKRDEINLVSVVLIAAILVPTTVMEFRWNTLQSVGSNVVAHVSGKPSGYLKCQRFSESFFDGSARLGHVKTDKPDEAFLTEQTCQNLFSWMMSAKDEPTLKQVIAVQVLLHESLHVSGDYVESSAECHAMQEYADVAVQLGASAEEARSMVDKYYSEVYTKMGEKYVSVECVNGGLFDDNPASNVFP